MAKAEWNGALIAQSDDIVMVEGNAYFPRAAVVDEYLRPCDRQTFCGWKGVASYFTLEVAGERNEAAVWFYAEPFEAARQVADRVAFWNGVTVTL